MDCLMPLRLPLVAATLTLAAATLTAQSIQIPAHIAAAHPRVSTIGHQSPEELRIRLQHDPAVRAAVQHAEAELAPYLAKNDSMWLASRLQMYWKSHATEIYNRSDVFDHAAGHGDVATVRFPGSRDPVSIYRAPRLEEIPPYEDDTLGVWLRNGSLPGQPMEWAPPEKSGRVIDGINAQILHLAQTAARLYWITNDERYAALAFPVLDVYLRGINARSEPIDLNHGHSQTIYGITTFEVIQEGVIQVTAETYDLLHDYVARVHPEALPVYANALRKWTDVTIRNGVPFNNWDLIEARYIASVALVLEDDSAYSDHRGAQFYLHQVLDQNSTRQWSLHKLAARGFDSETGIWFESPGYSVGVVKDFITLINQLDNALGTDLLLQLPVVAKAVYATGQYLNPTGGMVAFGDSHYGPLSDAAALEMVRNAQIHHRREQEVRFTGLAKLLQTFAGTIGPQHATTLNFDSFFGPGQVAIDPNIPALSQQDVTSPTFSAPSVSWFAQRNGTGDSGMMISEAGSLGNHQHANGVTIELFGRGGVLAPESGIGTNYFEPDHAEYYSQFPAHNTVVVDGISSYPAMKSHHGFTVRAAFPATGDTASGFDKATFTEVDFLEPETNADQRRLTGIVRTGNGDGYFIDIFRSRRRDGADLKHDYFFHGVGQNVAVTDALGHALEQTTTERLTFADEELPAYDYLWDKHRVATAPDYRAVFHLAISGRPEVDLHMWMNGDAKRELFVVKAPPSHALRDTVPADIAKLPLPTIILRQHGEAWTHPFAAIFEPADTGHPAQLGAIQQFVPTDAPAGFVGLNIASIKGKSQQLIFSSPDSTATVAYEGIEFQGSYAVVSSGEHERWMLLGYGRRLIDHGIGLEFDSDASGAIVHAGASLQVLLNEPGRLLLPYSELQRKITISVGSGSSQKLPCDVVRQNATVFLSCPLPAIPLTTVEVH